MGIYYSGVFIERCLVIIMTELAIIALAVWFKR